MENEFGNIGKILKAGGLKTAPPSLDGLIMDKIVALERRRTYRRLVFLLVIKLLAICAILALVGGAVWRSTPEWHGTIGMKQVPEIWEQIRLLLTSNALYIVPIFVLLIFGRILAPRLER